MGNEVDQIKERVGVVELIGEYLKLDKAGSNFKGLCPFHNEKTPSFMVNPDRNFWYCFGCQKGGDIFSFVQEIEGIDFPDALKRLADKAGVELPKYEAEATKGERFENRRALEILELATKVFEHFLKNHPKSGPIRDYLSRRKLTPELLEKFRVGYAPDGWRTILEFLLKKGFSLGEIVATGLVVGKNQNVQSSQDVYDRFRDRIVFPIIDISGRVVGFSARVAPGGDEKSAKYINTPQTKVYDKSSVLYGLNQAKTGIRKKDFAIVVEGNVDVISSHLTDSNNVVAVSGTALTQKQVSLIKRYSENVKLCFDMDEAGQRATRKSIQICLQAGMEVEVILLNQKGAKDVSDLVCESSEDWNKAVSGAIPVMEYFFSSSLSCHDPDDVKDKKNIAKELLSVIKDIADPIEQGYWIKKLSLTIGVEEEVLTGILEKVRLKDIKAPKHESSDESFGQKPNKSRLQILEERFLGLFSLYSEQLHAKAKEMECEKFGDEVAEIWKDLIDGDSSRHENKLNQFSASIKFRYDEKQGFVENDIDFLSEWETILVEIKKERKKMKMRKIGLDIKKAQQEGDAEAVEILLEEFNKQME
ncbi:MAG: DNA primase [Patescibacteria group bacterium]|nr:DNA primase [Patescibacteria group bacterium]